MIQTYFNGHPPNTPGANAGAAPVRELTPIEIAQRNIRQLVKGLETPTHFLVEADIESDDPWATLDLAIRASTALSLKRVADTNNDYVVANNLSQMTTAINDLTREVRNLRPV